MRTPTEKQLEVFVRDPSQLSVEDREWIEGSLLHDEGLRLLVEWFKIFFKLKEDLKDVKPKLPGQSDQWV